MTQHHLYDDTVPFHDKHGCPARFRTNCRGGAATLAAAESWFDTETEMLQNIPHPVGGALAGFRTGIENVACFSDTLERLPATMTLRSPAFDNATPIPRRFTADGEKVSPPLEWSHVPSAAAALVVLIEDADAPSVAPLVHGIVTDLPPGDGHLNEGELKSPAGEGAPHLLGRNSVMKPEYLPPDPPQGHGQHRYVFQVYALNRPPAFDGPPGRSELLDLIRIHGLAKGVLLGTYERA
jgi:Raf kinase inhibitor-like YbhB/YbcL family protein